VDIRLVLCYETQMTVVKVISLNLFPYHQLWCLMVRHQSYIPGYCYHCSMPSQIIPCPIRTFPSESSKTQRVSDQKLGNKSRCQIGKVMIGVAIPITSSMHLQRTLRDGLLVSIKEKTLTFSSVFPVGSRQSKVNLFYLAVWKVIALQTSLTTAIEGD